MKTVKRWRRLGQWQPRQMPARPRAIDEYAEFIRRRAPEVDRNGVVVHRELHALGFRGGYLQVQRFLQPLRSERRWASVATLRFETPPGQQSQIDWGQARVYFREQPVVRHLFVLTLGYSRRSFYRACLDETLPANARIPRRVSPGPALPAATAQRAAVGQLGHGAVRDRAGTPRRRWILGRRGCGSPRPR